MNQSELLTQFYRAYVAWIDDGAPEGILFERGHGLCMNLRKFSKAIGLDAQQLYETGLEFVDQIVSAGLDIMYPFNAGERMYYLIEQDLPGHGPSCHTNSIRLDWARNHAQSTEESQPATGTAQVPCEAIAG
jgi:hypothetical protein